MAESITHRAIHRLVDRAAGALISRRSLTLDGQTLSLHEDDGMMDTVKALA